MFASSVLTKEIYRAWYSLFGPIAEKDEKKYFELWCIFNLKTFNSWIWNELILKYITWENSSSSSNSIIYQSFFSINTHLIAQIFYIWMKNVLESSYSIPILIFGNIFNVFHFHFLSLTTNSGRNKRICSYQHAFWALMSFTYVWGIKKNWLYLDRKVSSH